MTSAGNMSACFVSQNRPKKLCISGEMKYLAGIHADQAMGTHRIGRPL